MKFTPKNFKLLLVSIILYKCNHHSGPQLVKIQKISNHALVNTNWYFYTIDKGYILEDRAEWLYKTQDLDNLCGQLSSRHYNNATLIKFYQYNSLNKTSLMALPVDVPVWAREISPLDNDQQTTYVCWE